MSFSERFPRTARYNPDWLLSAISGAANPLMLAEWLGEAMHLKPGMRVLDLGCGRALSSIFLHQQFDAEVWAADLWFSAEENQQRIRDAGISEGVLAIHADARALPLAPQSFDAIVAVDCYPYFGTDDLYLANLGRFLKPGGDLGIAGAGFMREFETPPDHLREWWTPDLWCLHSPAWWSAHWSRTGIVHIELADTLTDGCKAWLDWHRIIAPDNHAEIAALEADQGSCLGYLRVVARRTTLPLEAPMTSIPTDYRNTPVFRA